MVSVDGQWGEWTVATLESCNLNKDEGIVSRTRWCNAPRADYGGKWCDGKNRDEKRCSDPEIQYSRNPLFKLHIANLACNVSMSLL